MLGLNCVDVTLYVYTDTQSCIFLLLLKVLIAKKNAESRPKKLHAKLLKGQKVKSFLNQTKRTKPKCSEEKLPSVTMFRAQFSHRLHFHPSLAPSLLHPPPLCLTRLYPSPFPGVLSDGSSATVCIKHCL